MEFGNKKTNFDKFKLRDCLVKMVKMDPSMKIENMETNFDKFQLRNCSVEVVKMDLLDEN